MSVGKRFLWVVTCMMLTGQAWSQVANSPFSKFGVGQRYTPALANTQGMGGIGVAQPQYWYVNNQNPALLVYNTITSIQAGIVGESLKITDGTSVEKNRSGNMNYLVMAFPALRLKKHPNIVGWTTSAGLMPYSTMNYNVQYNTVVDGATNLKIHTTEQGVGGLTQLYWANGIRVNKNFSVGVKATYLFGTIDKSYRFDATYGSAAEDKNSIRGFDFSLGGSFSKDSLFGRDYRISVGVVYDFAATPRSHLKNKVSLLRANGDSLVTYTYSNAYQNMQLPASITGGVSISRPNWSFGTEFNYQDWTTFRSPREIEEVGAQKSWRASVGGEFTPDQMSESIFKRLTYRLGGSVEEYPFQANNQPVRDLGINFGFSVPTGLSGRSSLDLGFRIGKRGDKNQNILEENYFRIFLGVTFNDQWFIKRKFD